LTWNHGSFYKTLFYFILFLFFTKLVIKQKNKPYTDRPIYLNLPTLKYRRLQNDMIGVFKITHNICDTTDFSFNERKIFTRGNNYKLHDHSFHYDTRKRFFSARIVNVWNSLLNSVVDACYLPHSYSI